MPRINRSRRAFERSLHRIRVYALFVFRHVHCPQTRDDLVAETQALAWKWWLELWRKGKRPERFVSALATYAARAVKCGRRVCGTEPGRDVLSPTAQMRKGFFVARLPGCSIVSGGPLAEALQDNRKTPVPDQVAFRFDFPAWVGTYDERRRQMIEAMAQGERTLDLARRFGVSPGRVSQLRREFMVGWLVFTEEV